MHFISTGDKARCHPFVLSNIYKLFETIIYIKFLMFININYSLALIFLNRKFKFIYFTT